MVNSLWSLFAYISPRLEYNQCRIKFYWIENWVIQFDFHNGLWRVRFLLAGGAAFLKYKSHVPKKFDHYKGSYNHKLVSCPFHGPPRSPEITTINNFLCICPEISHLHKHTQIVLCKEQMYINHHEFLPILFNLNNISWHVVHTKRTSFISMAI